MDVEQKKTTASTVVKRKVARQTSFIHSTTDALGPRDSHGANNDLKGLLRSLGLFNLWLSCSSAASKAMSSADSK